MEHLLIAALYAAFLTQVYDTFATGPSWARTLLTGFWGVMGVMILTNRWTTPRDGAVGLAAGFLALLLVALLQLVMVQRDVVLSRAFSRR